jgi:hypothetical protein
MWWDGATGRPIPGEHLWVLEPDPKVEELKPGTIRIVDALKQLPTPGMVLTVKGMMEPNRTSPAIRISHCRDVLLEDVTLHHAGGMGVIVQRSEDITLRRLQVALPEGKGRFVTTTADATHFNGCRGRIVIEDCLFEHMLDDSANVHGCFVRVERQLGPETLVCRRVHSQQLGLVVMEAGDHVRFVTSDDLQPYGDATVVSTRELNFDLFEVTLDRLPEGGLRQRSGIYNLTWQPDFTFRNSTVRNHRARTMLIATAGKVLIEDNHFAHSSLAGIQFEGDNGYWWESGPTRQVIIRNNTFLDNYGPVLRIMPQIDPQRFPDALYHGGIVFENNRIESFHRRVVEGQAIDGLVFRKNTIRMTDTFDDPDTVSPSFDLWSGRNIRIVDNTFEGRPPLIVRAETDSARPVLKGNVGILGGD